VNLVGWVAGLVAGLAVTALGEMFSEEARARLDRLPHALLAIAIGRLPAEIRLDVGDEWQAELRHILRGAQAYPVTRLIHGMRFALGLLWSAPRIGRELASVRERPSPVLGRSARYQHRERLSLPKDADFALIVGPGLALASGVVVAGVLQSWRLGVTCALLTAGCDITLRRMTAAVIPAERRAARARRRTRRGLARLTGAGYICLHGCAIPGSSEMIDHEAYSRHHFVTYS
jgi:hypothetical protein